MNNQISAKSIKELREKTGAGISDIKKALEDSDGDMAKAVELIEERLGSLAGKREGREALAGIIDTYLHSNGRVGAMLELLCETDFVARNSEFKTLAHDLSMQIAAMGPADQEAMLEQQFIKDPGKTVQELVNEAAGKFGENIKIGRFIRFEM